MTDDPHEDRVIGVSSQAGLQSFMHDQGVPPRQDPELLSLQDRFLHLGLGRDELPVNIIEYPVSEGPENHLTYGELMKKAGFYENQLSHPKLNEPPPQRGGEFN